MPSPADTASVHPPGPLPEARAIEADHSHRWRGSAMPGQELLRRETPEECIARLQIPADSKLEALCRPAPSPPSK